MYSSYNRDPIQSTIVEISKESLFSALRTSFVHHRRAARRRRLSSGRDNREEKKYSEVPSFINMSDKGGDNNKKQRKRKAPPAPVEDDTGIDWQAAYESGDLTKFKNADLKTKLKSLGESGAGTKPVMVERLMAALEAAYGAESSKGKKKTAQEDEEEEQDEDDEDDDDDDDE
jgi:SAP domain